MTKRRLLTEVEKRGLWRICARSKRIVGVLIEAARLTSAQDPVFVGGRPVKRLRRISDAEWMQLFAEPAYQEAHSSFTKAAGLLYLDCWERTYRLRLARCGHRMLDPLPWRVVWEGPGSGEGAGMLEKWVLACRAGPLSGLWGPPGGYVGTGRVAGMVDCVACRPAGGLGVISHLGRKEGVVFGF
jgi:hypothetical protein